MPSIRRVLSICLVAATLIAGGCEKSESRARRSARNVSKSVAPKPGPEVLVKVSQEEARAFAEKLEAAFLGQDPEPFEELIDWGAIRRRSTAGLDAPKQTHSSVTEVLTPSHSGNRILRQLRDDHGDSAFKFLNVREVEGRTWVTFRLSGGYGLRDYVSFLMTRRDAKAIATEYYMYGKGQTVSSAFRMAIIMACAKDLSAPGADLDPRLIEYRMHIKTLDRMTTHFLMNRPIEGLADYDSLPLLIQREKALLLMRFQMAAMLGGDALETACRDFRAAYPDDPCIDFVMLAHFTERGRVPESLEVIDRIDHSVGGDPYLHSLRASVVLKHGDSQRARHHAELAMRALPDMADPYFTMVDVALLEKDYALLSELLLKLQHQFQFDLSEVPLSPIYAEFLESEPGREWLALQTGGIGALR